MTVTKLFDDRVEASPDATYLRYGDRSLTYRQTYEQSRRWANAFGAAGLSTGDRAGVLSKNNLDCMPAYLGALRAGVVPVPLNYRLAPGEWAYILDDSGSKVCICDEACGEGLDTVRRELSSVGSLVSLAGESREGWVSSGDWLASGDGAEVEPDLSGDHACFQFYTSGTTGRPKGAIATHSSTIETIRSAGPALTESDEIHLMVLPLYHIFGLIVAINAGFTGSSVVIREEFNPADVVAMLSSGGIHIAPLVPAMMQACLALVPDVAERDYSDLRLIAYGASTIAAETLRRAAEVFRCDFLQIYGMSEFAPITYLTPADHATALSDAPELLASAGKAAPDVELKVVDGQGADVPTGETGEIICRGPMVMEGYWNRREATEEALRGGWMHTGDAGRLDGDGYLYIQDRVKDMIVSGGENVYPREVEVVLFEHPDVVDAAVIGIPDEKWGEAVKAVVVLRQGANLAEDQVIEFCRGRLGGFKCPRSVDFMEQLPRNPSGKVLKRELREPYWEGQSRQVGGS